MRELLDSLLDLVLPQECSGCGLPATRWCATCAAELAAVALRPLGRAAPIPPPAGFPVATAGAVYDGVVRAALLAHKEQGRLALSRPLRRALAAAVAALEVSGPLLLVPAPSALREVGCTARRRSRPLSAGSEDHLIGSFLCPPDVAGSNVGPGAGNGAARHFGARRKGGRRSRPVGPVSVVPPLSPSKRR